MGFLSHIFTTTVLRVLKIISVFKIEIRLLAYIKTKLKLKYLGQVLREVRYNIRKLIRMVPRFWRSNMLKNEVQNLF